MTGPERAPSELGFSDCMGEQLRAFVEEELICDLNQYLSDGAQFRRSDVWFDWSESCIEGHRTTYLDGDLENFSGIAVYDKANQPIGEGWMEFVKIESSLRVFWWYLHPGQAYQLLNLPTGRIPWRVWDDMDAATRSAWGAHAPSGPRKPGPDKRAH